MIKLKKQLKKFELSGLIHQIRNPCHESEII